MESYLWSFRKIGWRRIEALSGIEMKREGGQSSLLFLGRLFHEIRAQVGRCTWKTRVFSVWCIPQRIAILILEYRSARGLVFAKSGCNRGDRGISKRAKFKLAAISWRFSLSSPPVISTLPLRTSARVPSLNAYADGYLKCQIRNRNTGVLKLK